MTNHNVTNNSQELQQNDLVLIDASLGSPRNFNRHAAIGQIESVLRLAESMEVISESVVSGFNDGDTYESIGRMALSLHSNLVQLSKQIKGVLPENEQREKDLTYGS